jgi:hypothetical protein
MMHGRIMADCLPNIPLMAVVHAMICLCDRHGIRLRGYCQLCTRDVLGWSGLVLSSLRCYDGALRSAFTVKLSIQNSIMYIKSVLAMLAL